MINTNHLSTMYCSRLNQPTAGACSAPDGVKPRGKSDSRLRAALMADLGDREGAPSGANEIDDDD
jgi:hypothetical protein